MIDTSGFDFKSEWADNEMKIGSRSVCRVVDRQKVSFTTSCPTRGLTEVLPMTPKVAELKLLSGSANCGWLKRLKNSALNCTPVPVRGHRSATVLVMETSRLTWSGTFTIPVALISHVVTTPSAPIIGGVVKHVWTK